MLALMTDSESVTALRKQTMKPSLLGDIFSQDRKENIFSLSRNVFDDCACDADWSKLVKSVRQADDKVHNLRFTNTFAQQKLGECYDNLSSLKKLSNLLNKELDKLSKLDSELDRAVKRRMAELAELQQLEEKNDQKFVKFSKMPRKSKSAEYSVHQMCSACNAALWPKQTPLKKEKRKMNYGKFCSSCGIIEVSSQYSLVKCYDCNGEIILPGLCSSCDSLKTKKLRTWQNKKMTDRACSACSFHNKNAPGDANHCTKCRIKKAQKNRRKMNYAEESSCCSDCEYASSCDLHNVSAESLVPMSESDQVMNFHPFTHDIDISCSVSSSGTEFVKDGKPKMKIPAYDLDHVQEELVEDEFNTPKEGVSVEDVPTSDVVDEKTIESDKKTSCSDDEFEEALGDEDTKKKFPEALNQGDVKTCDEEKNENVHGEGDGEYIDKNCEECVEEKVQEYWMALEDVATEEDKEHEKDPVWNEVSLLKDIATKRPVTQVCDRMENAEQSINSLISGNSKIEEHISTIENISEQNIKLSLILREIMLGMTNHLDVIHKQIKKAQETAETQTHESEGSEEFTEAVEDLSENDMYYDFSNQDLMCGQSPNAVSEPDRPPEGASKAIETYRKPGELVQAVLPVMVDPTFPMTALESKLKVLESETTTLRDNNEFISVLIDQLQDKLRTELKRMKSKHRMDISSNELVSESKYINFDLSYYQYITTITEKGTKESAIESAMFNEVTPRKRNFMEMKIEEIFKKEEQTALELEVFHQKLAVEGLIIKEREEFYTCSNCSQLTDRIEDLRIPAALARRYTSERFQTNARGDRENDELTISIEIEVENDKKKSLRCEYKANVQKKEKKLTDQKVPLTLFPLWAKERIYGESVRDFDSVIMSDTVNDYKSKNISIDSSDKLFNGDDMYFIDMQRDDFVEIKKPGYYYSSDEESCISDCITDKKRSKCVAVAEMRMPIALYTVTEIRAPQTPFAVLDLEKRTCHKREYGRISQIEQEETLNSGIVILQTEAIASVGLINSPSMTDLQKEYNEFYEARSQITLDSFSIEETEQLIYFAPQFHPLSAIAIEETNTLPLLITSEAVAAEEGREELKKAISLIREIESDVVEVKLHSAIAILPKLESILREHMQDKLKVFTKRTPSVGTTNIDVFMSTLDFTMYPDTPKDTPQDSNTQTPETQSEDRLSKIFTLLNGLENAVKDNPAEEEPTDDGPERIQNLVGELSDHIKGIQDEPDLLDMQKTLDIASQLDVAVRNYSSNFSTQEKDQARKESKSLKADRIYTCEESLSDEDSPVVEKIRAMKKKIFQTVDTEAKDREDKIVRNYDKIQKLERENAEVMCFLDTLLDKMLHRVRELDEVRVTAYQLSEIAAGIACFLERSQCNDGNQQCCVRCITTDIMSGNYRRQNEDPQQSCDNLKEKTTRAPSLGPCLNKLQALIAQNNTRPECSTSRQGSRAITNKLDTKQAIANCSKPDYVSKGACKGSVMNREPCTKTEKKIKPCPNKILDEVSCTMLMPKEAFKDGMCKESTTDGKQKKQSPSDGRSHSSAISKAQNASYTEKEKRLFSLETLKNDESQNDSVLNLSDKLRGSSKTKDSSAKQSTGTSKSEIQQTAPKKEQSLETKKGEESPKKSPSPSYKRSSHQEAVLKELSGSKISQNENRSSADPSIVKDYGETKSMGSIVTSPVEETTSMEKSKVSPTNASVREGSETDVLPVKLSRSGRKPTLPSIEEVSTDNKTSGESSEDDKMKSSFSHMMESLEKLKVKAKEKKDRYDEIFGKKESTDQPQGTSTKEKERPKNSTPITTVLEKISANTYCLTWQRPSDEYGPVIGYEIWLNGRLYQRVRNPDRLKAVIVTNPQCNDESVCIKLYAMTEDCQRRSMAVIAYPQERG